MIWVITSSAENDGTFPTYRFYKKAFDETDIDIYCANGVDHFSFVKQDDTVLLRTRDKKIIQRLREAQKSVGFMSTIESSCTEFLTYDKEALKGVLCRYGINFPKSVELQELVNGKRYFVKPRYGEDSICVGTDSICTNIEQVGKKMQTLFMVGREPMVEEFIDGEELTTTIMNFADGIKCWSAITMRENSKILSRSVKISHDFIAKPYANTDCDRVAKMVFDAVGAKHLLRIDFRLHNGTPYVIDVNMLPGLAPDGFMARCVGVYGIGYYDLIRGVVNTASR